jgi:hypothetical protein
MVSGVRHSLFLCDTGSRLSRDAKQSTDFQWLLAPALAQFDFFERAVLFLNSTSDEELRRIVADYASFLDSMHGARVTKQDVSNSPRRCLWIEFQSILEAVR